MLQEPHSPVSQQSASLKEPWKTSHCAIYLEITEKHHRRGSILDHAFKIRHLQGFPAEFSQLVPEGSHVAYQWQLMQPGEVCREKEPASDQGALSSC